MWSRCLALALTLGAVPVLAAGPAQAFSGEAEGLGLGGRYAYVRNRDTDESTSMGGVLARLRGQHFGLEAAVDYRSEEIGNDVELKSWPVTASILVYPVRHVYGLAGLGWYNTTIDFPDDSSFDNETDSKLGYHVGAGAEVPLAPSVSITGDARWSFIDYDFDEIPSSIGEVGADTFALNAGLLFYLR